MEPGSLGDANTVREFLRSRTQQLGTMPTRFGWEERCRRPGFGVLLALVVLAGAPGPAAAQSAAPQRPTARRATARPAARPTARPAARPTARPAARPTPGLKPRAPAARAPGRPALPERPRAATDEITPKAEADPYAGLDHSGTPPGPPEMDKLLPQKTRPGQKRKAPSYDGRRSARPTSGQVLVWIPRVLFFPVYVTLEYLVRWPIVRLITLIEKHHLINYARGIFQLGTSNATLLPTLFIDFSRFKSVGAYFSYQDLGVKNNNLVVQVGLWSGHWYHAVVRDRFSVFAKDAGTVTLRTEFIWRPDYAFHGFGPDSRQQDESFFRKRHTETELSLYARLKNLNRFYVGALYRNVKISAGQGTSINDPSLPWVVAGRTEVPGFDQEYNLLTAKLQLDLDSRHPERFKGQGSGIRLEVFGSYSVDPGNTKLQLAQWGSELSGFLDITGSHHVLALRMFISGQERLGSDELPVSERLHLGGGTERMRGFLEGRFRGDSALLFTLQYRYPIWSLLDANLFVSVGNVFSGRFDDFAFRRMAMSWGIALRTNNSIDVSFDVLIAFGSNQAEHWRQGFKVDFIRVTAGINQGF